jgi:Domain of unknown function (DUF6249)
MTPEMIVTLIPLAVLGVVWAIAFAAFRFRGQVQQLRHSERLAAIEKGIDVPIEAPEPRFSEHVYLLRGLIWLFIGFGISIIFTALFLAEHVRELFALITLGLIPIGVGSAYLVVYRVELKRRREK